MASPTTDAIPDAHVDFHDQSERFSNNRELHSAPQNSRPHLASGMVENDPGLTLFIHNCIEQGTQDLYAEALERMEKQLFSEVLHITQGNQSKAAELLGITRGKVRDRVSTFGIKFSKTVSLGNPQNS